MFITHYSNYRRVSIIHPWFVVIPGPTLFPSYSHLSPLVSLPFSIGWILHYSNYPIFIHDCWLYPPLLLATNYQPLLGGSHIWFLSHYSNYLIFYSSMIVGYTPSLLLATNYQPLLGGSHIWFLPHYSPYPILYSSMIVGYTPIYY